MARRMPAALLALACAACEPEPVPTVCELLCAEAGVDYVGRSRPADGPESIRCGCMDGREYVIEEVS